MQYSATKFIIVVHWAVAILSIVLDKYAKHVVFVHYNGQICKYMVWNI